jgi:predicted metalloprotease
MGPFYCPGDHKVYLDMDFFNTMSRQLGAPGEFARLCGGPRVGHHVEPARHLGQGGRACVAVSASASKNAMSVRLELQADCLAGIWANKSQQAKSWLEQGDIESAMNAAQQIGDDKLQREATGTVRPDSFTHGSSAQRVRWFTQGYKTGSVKAATRCSSVALSHKLL